MMSTDRLFTAPPDSLRLGSPVRLMRRPASRGVIVAPPNALCCVTWTEGSRRPWTEDCAPFDLARDLGDATGRAHLAWWIWAQPSTAGRLTDADLLVIRQANGGRAVLTEQIDILAKLALRLTGRAS